jgi:Zn-dependent M16 (insulinase) family peptidase
VTTRTTHLVTAIATWLRKNPPALLAFGMLLCLADQPAEALRRQQHVQPPQSDATSLAMFRPRQVIAGFRILAHYTNHLEQPVGLRLTHTATGTPVHLIQMDTVPQAAMAIRTYPESDHGAAHALEHLLIGKGTTGRSLQALADMRLGQITASTGERYTWYHFAVSSGMASFYEVLGHLLQALFRPDFSDTEAQQEVYQIGIATEARTGQLRLIEQGTVYTEMHSYQGMYDYWYALLKRVIGANHPLTFPAGGTPDGLRRLTPQEIRQFHRAHYVLGASTPLVLVIDRQQHLAQVLATLSNMLTAFQHRNAGVGPAAAASHRMHIQPAEDKALQLVPMPGLNASDPATVVFGWRPVRLPTLRERLLLETFLAVFGQGTQSVLYRSIVDRQTRELDVGATGVDSLLRPTDDRERPLSLVWIEGIPGDRVTQERLEAIRLHVQSTLQKVASYADHSPALQAFNREILSYLTARQRALTVWHMNPPGFGQRRLDPVWIEHLEVLEGEPGVRKSLVWHSYWPQLISEIGAGINLWRGLIARAGLLETPYGAAALPTPEMQRRLEQEQHTRLAAEASALQTRYDTTDDQEALRQFAADQTRPHDRLAAVDQPVALPSFTTSPPHSFDDALQYAQLTIAGVPAVTSAVEGASLAEIGLAFDLRAVPPRLYRYLPLLPGLLRSIGVREDGVVTTHQASEDHVQQHLHRLETNYRVNPEVNRYELVIKASGVGLEEFQAALEYVRRITHDNDLSAHNLRRINDLLQYHLSIEKTQTQRPEEEWIETLAKAFRFQDNHLFLSLSAYPTRGHHLNRLTWLLTGPVPVEVLADLQAFAARLLEPLRGLSVVEMEQTLAGMQETGLRGQLVDYWRAQLRAWPAPLVWQGLQRLSAEALADLQVGHARALQEMQELQALVLNRSRLRLWLVGDRHLLQHAHTSVEALVQSFQRQEMGDAHVDAAPLVWERLRSRQPELTAGYPAYVGYVQENAVTGSVIATAKGPTYREADAQTLVELLAAKVLAGTGPHTWYKKTWEAGLAYGNGLDVRPREGTVLYYADRCPSVRATLAFVRHLAQDVSWLSEKSYIDYALAQTFNFSRLGQTWAERADAMASDLAEGLTPERMLRFSQRVLQLRRDPELLERIRQALPRIIARVTQGEGDLAVQSAAQSIFFVIAPERQLAELEDATQRRPWARVWPSDFWLE